VSVRPPSWSRMILDWRRGTGWRRRLAALTVSATLAAGPTVSVADLSTKSLSGAGLRLSATFVDSLHHVPALRWPWISPDRPEDGWPSLVWVRPVFAPTVAK